METLDIQIELAEQIDDNEITSLITTMREKLILELFRKGKISTSFAAKQLGLGVYDFLDHLAGKDIPYINKKVSLEKVLDFGQNERVLGQKTRERENGTEKGTGHCLVLNNGRLDQ